MIRFGAAETASSTVSIANKRIVPNAHTRDVIYGVVLHELSRVMPHPEKESLSPHSVLTEAGIDDGRLEDAIVRLQGSYGMRLREEWVRDIHTCEDLVTCIATRMFDTKDCVTDEVFFKDSNRSLEHSPVRKYSFEDRKSVV